MRAKINKKDNSAWLTAALCLALTALGLLHFGGTGTRWLTLLAGAGIIVLLLRGVVVADGLLGDVGQVPSARGLEAPYCGVLLPARRAAQEP